MSELSKSDYELANLGVCIRQHAERLGIKHEGVPLEGVVGRIAVQALAHPKGGCSCSPAPQNAGGGYIEYLLEYEPDCPEHSEHVYDPRAGKWIFRDSCRNT